ncbi:hypothetical protein C0J52_02711 [Blattella germanica]|nr:hypothetical protein C0J52_02711 [Blattella germanica]
MRLLLKTVYCSLTSRRRRTADRTDAAAVVLYTHAPPATVRLHLLQDQIPTQNSVHEYTTEIHRILTFPQNVHVYLEC